MKRKKTKLKTIPRIIIIIFIILIVLFLVNKIVNRKESENTTTSNNGQITETSSLKKAGYNDDEEQLIISKLDENQIELVINEKYDKDLLLSLLKEKYFINSNLDRYISFYEKDTEKDFQEIIKDINSNIDYEFYTEQIPSDDSKGILMIANKHYALSEDFNGLNVVAMDYKYSYYDLTYYLNNEAYEHFEKMWADAKKEGLDFAVYSGYRSYQTQQKLYNNYVNVDGKDLADTYSARPGNSEHQLGLAVDLKSRTKTTDYFETTEEYKWLQDNSYKYGFIMRYPLGQEYITGYQYEPWHYRYCGIDCATYIHENGITFEEYYEYYVKNK